MALPDYTTQDAATYKANIDSSVDDHETRITANESDITACATLTGAQTLTNKTLTSPVLNTGVSGTAVLDEDDMSSDSATKLATQQSIKAYVDSKLILLDTPELVLNDLTPPTTSTAVNVATLNTAGATKAILSAYLANNGTTYLGFSSASVSIHTRYQKIACDSGARSRSEFTVGLDANNDFWWYSSDSSITIACQVYLIGYYV